MTYHKDKVSVLVQTCDSYSFLEGWYVMFNRFWAWDLDWQIYFCNEEVDFPYKDDRIKQIKTVRVKNIGVQKNVTGCCVWRSKQIDEGE